MYFFAKINKKMIFPIKLLILIILLENHESNELNWEACIIKDTEFLCPRKGLSSLNGLANYTQINHLDLNTNQIKYLDEITRLTNLIYLDLNSNNIESIEGLDSLPLLTYLDVSANQIQSVESISYLTRLTHLDLSSNKIQSIRGLEHLPWLTHLDLSTNRIQYVEGLENLTNLTFLDLSTNQIQSLEGLANLTRLDTLNLALNQIESIEDLGNLTILSDLALSSNLVRSLDGLKGLTEINRLYLDKNKIDSVRALANLTQLNVLYLFSNELRSLEGIEKLTQLYFLLLFNNKIESARELENLDQLDYLELSSNQLDSVAGLENFVRLNSINLHFNRIESIQSLADLTLLSYIDVSNNRLKSLRGVENLSNVFQLYLFSNKIESVQELENLAVMTHLDASSNRIKSLKGLEKLFKLTLLSLYSNLIESVEELTNLNALIVLDLGSNQIECVNGLGKLSNLKSLVLTNNKIKIFSTNFVGTHNLLHLYIDNNFIVTLCPYLFANLTNIKLISLRNNKISSIADKTFHGTNSTENIIDLSSNENISDIYLSTFKGLGSLRLSMVSFMRLTQKYHYSFFDFATLDLSQNKISRISANSIKGLFKYLILQDNSIVAFERNAFGYLPSLAKIDFSKNLIKSLNFSDAFASNLTKLNVLYFHFNKIQSIDSDFFIGFPNLTSLDLSNNHLLLISKFLFLNLNQLEILNLSNNQILTIENNSFDFMTSLKHLSLKNNLIYELPGGIFNKLNMLKELLLDSNKLEVIRKEYFFGLANLVMLDLSGNLLKSLQDDNFSHLPAIQVLILKANRIESYVTFQNLKRINNLDISLNNIKYVNFNNSFASLSKTLTFLDMSGNSFTNEHVDLRNFSKLKALNLSKTNSDVILGLAFPVNSSIVELDLSYNNLSLLKHNYFGNLMQLTKLNLKETSLHNFDFLNTLTALSYIDLSNNLMCGSFLKNFRFFQKINHLKISNVSIFSYKKLHTSLGITEVKLVHLDLSYNNLKQYYYETFITHMDTLDLSFNDFHYLFTEDTIITHFAESYVKMTVINMASSISASLSHKILYFNKNLEYASLSNNYLQSLPRFCQTCLYYNCEKLDEYDFECKLKTLYFNSNNLKMLSNRDLLSLTNLEYLNMENNSISFIESRAFSYLGNLEILILSHNKLSLFNESHVIFNFMDNLKFINLSSNSIEVISSFLFSDLLKLEVIDLSFNKIYKIENYSFNKLTSLRDLHLNNDLSLELETNCFIELDTIQNIYISKQSLNDRTNSIFGDLFTHVNRNPLRKNERTYFRSLSLSTEYKQYDCELTIYFIRHNIHLNLKDEIQIYDYFAACSQLTVMNKLPSENLISAFKRNETIFTNTFFLFIWFLILLIT